MQYQTQDRANVSIKVAKLILQESGTYNPMFSRPYQTHVTNETIGNITRRIEQSYSPTITGELFAGAAAGMLQPAAQHQGEIPIPLSWAERRIRFIMEVHVMGSMGSGSVYYFQGYTSHLGVTPSGNVDPQMEFILNSFIRVNRTTVQGPYGASVQDVLTESAQIVNGGIVNHYQNTGVFRMRPQDIFTGVQSGYLENAYAGYSPNDVLMDMRYKMTGESIRTSRSNNIGGSYIAKIVDTYNNGKKLADFGQGQEDIMGRCQNMSHEPSPYENPFIRQMSNIRGVHCATTFSFDHLRGLDPNIEKVTNYITLGRTEVQQLHQAGQTSYWNGSDRETVMSTVLSNAIPAIMMDLMFSKLHFRSTNHSAGGVINTVFINSLSLTNADLSQNFETFKYRLDKEILFDLTYGNQVLYNLEMDCDLFGETRITIQVDGGPVISYTTPSFCDSLLTPVITSNKDSYFGVVNDFETLMNSLPTNKVSGVNLIV